MVLDDICVLIADCPHSTAPDEGSGYPLIRTPNIGKARFLLDGVNRVSKQVYEQRNKRATPQDNDIIFAREAPAGNAAIIKNGDKYCLGQRTVLIRPDPQKVNPDYLVYYLLAPEQQHKLLSTAHGATVSHVNIPDIHNMNVDNLPSIENQKQIANTLIAYDDLIENNQKQIKLLEEAAQRLYKEWFIDLRFPGHESTPIHDGIPAGWERTTVERIAAVLRRGISPTYDSNGDSTVINQKCIRQTIVDLGEARKQTKKYPDELNLQNGDTVICSTGDGTLGRVGQIFGELEKTTLDSHVTLVRATSDVGTQLLFWTIKSQQAFLQGMGKGSTNQLELSRSVIQELPFILPDSNTRMAFEVLAQAIHDKITAQNKQIIELQTARDRLLPKLMSGEIEILKGVS